MLESKKVGNIIDRNSDIAKHLNIPQSKLLIDKYLPNRLSDYKFLHGKVIKNLPLCIPQESKGQDVNVDVAVTNKLDSQITAKPYIRNMILYGCQGAGKSRLARAIVNEAYGYTSKWEEFSISTTNKNGKEKIQELELPRGTFHLELYPELIKDGITNIYSSMVKNQQVIQHKIFPYTVIIIHNIDTLEQKRQRGLLKFIGETKHAHVVLIATTSRLCRVDKALKSRCSLVRVPGYDLDTEIFPLVNDIVNKEKIQFTWDLLYARNFWRNKINRSLTRLLIFLDYFKSTSDSFNSSRLNTKMIAQVESILGLLRSPIEKAVKDLSRRISNVNTIGNNKEPAILLAECRDTMVEILKSGYKPQQLIKDLYKTVSQDPCLTTQQRQQVIKYACKYDYNLVRGQDVLCHITAFIANLLKIYSGC